MASEGQQAVREEQGFTNRGILQAQKPCSLSVQRMTSVQVFRTVV